MSKTFFGIRELHIAPIVSDDATGTTYGELIRCQGIQDFSVSPQSSEYTLEGDDTLQAVETLLEGFQFSFSNGVVSLEQRQALEGGTITQTLAGDNVYVNNTSDAPQYFGVIGRVAGDANTKVILPKCKATSVEQSFAQKSFALLTVSGTAIKRESDGHLKLQYENTDPISVTDFNADTQ